MPISAFLRPAAPVPGRFTVPSGAHVAVVQPLPGIGDMIWHLPHIRAIAGAVGAPVTLVTKPGSAADQILPPNPASAACCGCGVAPRGRSAGRSGLRAALRAEGFAALVLLHHSLTLAAVAALAGVPARHGYGFGAQRLFLNRPPFLPAAALTLHPYMQATAWLAAAGIAMADAEPLLPVLASAAAAVPPGSAAGRRRW